jgi:hypothetical protein
LVASTILVLLFCYLIIPYFKLLIQYDSIIYSINNIGYAAIDHNKSDNSLNIDSREADSLLVWLETEAKKNELSGEAKLISAEEVSSMGYKTIKIKFYVVGSYKNIINFVDLVNYPNNQYLISLEQADFKKEKKSDQYRADLIFESYWLK